MDTTTANPSTTNVPDTTVLAPEIAPEIADPTNANANALREQERTMVEEAHKVAENPISMQSAELGNSESDATRNAIENASKVTEATRRKIADEATGQDTQQIGLDGKPVMKKARAWSYY